MQRRPRGSLEQEVLAAVAHAQAPQTVAQVAAVVRGSTAYTTVMTTLGRLHIKGALDRHRVGRGFVYSLRTAPPVGGRRAHGPADASPAAKSGTEGGCVGTVCGRARPRR